MNLLCVIDCLDSGGSQRQLIELASAIKERGHNVSFLIYYVSHFYSAVLEKRQIDVHLMEVPNRFRRIVKTREFIRKGNFDTVLSFLEGPNFICEIAGLPSRKWKVIVGERSANPNINRSLSRKVLRFFHLLADCVVANSNANLSLLRTVNPFLPQSKCRVIYNVVDSNYWKPSDDYSPLKNGKLRLLVIASHQYLKNLDGLIEALSRLDKEDLEKLRIDWYGDRLTEPYYSESYPEGQRKLQQLGLSNAINFYPATKNILQKIQDADAVGLFSLYEGLPNSICEAMACGKTVLCSAVSDLPHLLKGTPDLLFNPADPESIANSIRNLLLLSSGELISIGSNNRELAIETFDREAQVDKYLDLMKA
jgi:glycosyltransferase involved in cell wall biosynthesis